MMKKGRRSNESFGRKKKPVGKKKTIGANDKRMVSFLPRVDGVRSRMANALPHRKLLRKKILEGKQEPEMQTTWKEKIGTLRNNGSHAGWPGVFWW